MTGADAARRFAVAVALVFLLSFASSAAQPDPFRLLDRMNDAIRSLDYEGRFVVQSGDRLDALYVVHRAVAGGERERLVSLNGEPREIIRSDEAVACLVPGKRDPINVGRRAHGRSFSPLRGVDPQQLSRYYDFHLAADGRVAGRKAFQVEVRPRDKLRFGYRVFVDQETALPLHTVTLDAEERVLTQMMFTELKVNDGITPIEHDISALQVARADPEEWSSLARLTPAAWRFAEIPPGYQLNLHRRRPIDNGGAELEHFIFSDGLATVSVYVLPLAGHADQLSSAEASANAVGRVLGEHEVVVVGDVPRQTLDWFAKGIRAAR
jgi:sigma-E factor negative regulatory protein RseB